MLTRILHVSDLHVGANAADAEWALAPLIDRFKPELVIASGDLSHRGTPEQHETAATLLRALGPPLLAVPGNHDIPYTFPKRFTRTFEEFERQWETTEPVFRSERILAVGLNSVRAWRYQGGGIGEAQLARAAQVLRTSEGTSFGSRCCTITSSERRGGRARSRSRSETTCSRPSSTRARN